MTEQQKSKTVKYGEGKYHAKARQRIEKALTDKGWTIQPETILWLKGALRPIYEDREFVEIKYRHPWDIYARKKHDNGLSSDLIIEIDGLIHESDEQKKRDKQAEEFAAFFLSDTRFVRMPISLALNLNISDGELLKSYGIK